MKNVNRPNAIQTPFVSSATPFLSNQSIQAALQKLNAPSMLRAVSAWIPNSPGQPQYTVQPLKWGDALKLSGWNVFKNIYVAALLFDALRAESANHRAIETRYMQERMLEAIREEQLKGAGHADLPSAPENAADEGYEAESTIAETADTEQSTALLVKLAAIGAVWAARMEKAYADSYGSVHDELGRLGVDPARMTQNQVNDYVAQYKYDPQYHALHIHLLNEVSVHSKEFGLENVGMVDHFLNRLTALLHANNNNVQDLQQLDGQTPGNFATKLGSALDTHCKTMAEIAHEMGQVSSNGVQAATGQKPSPASIKPNATDFNAEVASLGAPADAAHQVTQWRLALIKLMFPDAPQPGNSQKRALDAKMQKDVASHNTHEALADEIRHYGGVLGVEIRTLEKAADHTFLKLFSELAKDKNIQVMFDGNTAALDPQKQKSFFKKMMEQQMKPPSSKN